MPGNKQKRAKAAADAKNSKEVQKKAELIEEEDKRLHAAACLLEKACLRLTEEAASY
jgi:hypothetical protein